MLRARHRPERVLLAQALPGAPLNPSTDRFALSAQQFALLVAADARLGPQLAGDEARRHRLSAARPSARSRCGSACRCSGARAALLKRAAARSARDDWRELGKLTLTNMIVWHVLAILAVQALSSGRAAILGYTMPIFSALWGVALFGERLRPRQRRRHRRRRARRRAAALARVRARSPAGRSAALGMLVAAAVWALGTQQLRRTRIDGADACDRLLDDAADDARDDACLTVALRARPLGACRPPATLGRDRLQRGR